MREFLNVIIDCHIVCKQTHIKELRVSAKLHQEELAILCKVSRKTINAIENDKYDPILQLAFNIASELDTTIDELVVNK